MPFEILAAQAAAARGIAGPDHGQRSRARTSKAGRRLLGEARVNLGWNSVVKGAGMVGRLPRELTVRARLLRLGSDRGVAVHASCG